MATKPNKNIKRLSTAIRRGVAIGKEAGIKKGKSQLIKTNAKGEVCKACTLGFALIGVLGIEGAKKVTKAGLGEGKGYNLLTKQFGDEDNTCLPKQLTTKKQQQHSGVVIYEDEDYDPVTNTYKVISRTASPQDFVMSLNDNTNLTPEQIAEKLANCKL